MHLELIAPDINYKASFTAMVTDYLRHGEYEKYVAFQPALEDFDRYVAAKHGEADGIGLKEGYVRATTYWLTDESKTLYGTIRYRPVLDAYLSRAGGHIGFDIAPQHRGKGYASTMLGLMLRKIDRRQNSSVLLTCNSDNIASRKVIEKNGGVLESEFYDSQEDRLVLRYWIIIP